MTATPASFAARKAAQCIPIVRWCVGFIRWVGAWLPDGTEVWMHTTPHPQSAGEYSKSSTIADYIAAQDALPFMRAADEYADWVRKAYAVTEASDSQSEADLSPDDLLDMDAAIAAHCAETDAHEPLDIEERRKLHMEVLYRQLDQCSGGEYDHEEDR